MPWTSAAASWQCVLISWQHQHCPLPRKASILRLSKWNYDIPGILNFQLLKCLPSVLGPENLINNSYPLLSIYIMPGTVMLFAISHLIPTLILEVGAILIPLTVMENEV